MPYLFFSLLLAFLSFFIPGWFPLVDLSTAKGYFMAAASTAMGFPLLNVPLWFVACLVSVECVHRLAQGILTSAPRILLAALVCYIGGYVLNEQYFFFGQGKSFWLLHEVPVVYAFYLAGVLMGGSRALSRLSTAGAVVVAVLALACVQLTFDLNQGPFRYLQAVIILLSGHGHFLWFPFTALAGTTLVLALGHLLRHVLPLVFLGRKALILLGMNSVFYHFVNPVVAKWSVTALPGDGGSVFLISALVTVASIGLSVTVIMALNSTVPQIVGKPRQAGRWFSPLVRE